MTLESITFWCRTTTPEGITPAFPVGADRKQETAQIWAKGCYYGYQTYHYESTAHSHTYPNRFSDVRLVDPVVRTEGGRAYKIHIHHDGYIFLCDFREFELLDVIQHAGIAVGGILQGDFTFVLDGSQTKLTRIGSETHQKFRNQQAKNAAPRVKLATLSPGTVCWDKSDNAYLYIGEIYAPSLTHSTWSHGGTHPPELYYTGIHKTGLVLRLPTITHEHDYEQLETASLSPSSPLLYIVLGARKLYDPTPTAFQPSLRDALATIRRAREENYPLGCFQPILREASYNYPADIRFPTIYAIEDYVTLFSAAVTREESKQRFTQAHASLPDPNWIHTK